MKGYDNIFKYEKGPLAFSYYLVTIALIIV